MYIFYVCVYTLKKNTKPEYTIHWQRIWGGFRGGATVKPPPWDPYFCYGFVPSCRGFVPNLMSLGTQIFYLFSKFLLLKFDVIFVLKILVPSSWNPESSPEENNLNRVKSWETKKDEMIKLRILRNKIIV